MASTSDNSDAEPSFVQKLGHWIGPLVAIEVLGGGQDVLEPSVEREIALRTPRTAGIERQRHPAHLLGDAVGERGMGRRRRRASIRAGGVAGYEDDARQPGAGDPGGASDVRGEPQSTDIDRRDYHWGSG